jgi:hypothetical protein
MVIKGAWLLCDDGVLRPIMRGEVRAADGEWIQVPFLVDVGADRTVFSEDVFRALGIAQLGEKRHFEGVGGKAESVILDTQIRLTRETGATILVNGPFAAFTDPAALDISVLGRDLTNLFAVLVDRPQDVVCLVGANHRCIIVEA